MFTVGGLTQVRTGPEEVVPVRILKYVWNDSCEKSGAVNHSLVVCTAPAAALNCICDLFYQLKNYLLRSSKLFQNFTLKHNFDRFWGADSFSFLMSFGLRRLKTSWTEDTCSWNSWSQTAVSAAVTAGLLWLSCSISCWNLCLESEEVIPRPGELGEEELPAGGGKFLSKNTMLSYLILHIKQAERLKSRKRIAKAAWWSMGLTVNRLDGW